MEKSKIHGRNANHGTYGGVSIKTGVVLFLNLCVAASIYYEPAVQSLFPGYSAVLFVSGIVFFAGLGYALILRSISIAFIAIVCTAAVPWLFAWFMAYWPRITRQMIFYG